MSSPIGVGAIAITEDGLWQIDYISYATGEASRHTLQGKDLAVLAKAIEKNKSMYLKEG